MTNISLNKDYLSVSELALNKYLIDKFPFILTDIPLKDNNNKWNLNFLDNFEVKKTEIKISNNHIKTYYENNNLMIIFNNISDNYYINIYAKELKVLEKVNSFFQKYKLEFFDRKNIVLYNYLFNNGKINIKKDSIKLESINYLKENYYPYFSNINLFFKSFYQSDENILIISGDTGTGKTKFASLFLKYLQQEEIKEQNLKAAYIKNDQLFFQDIFWSSLIENKIDIVIIDEFKDELLDDKDNTHNKERKKFTNNLLSYTDGLIKNNIKFVIITNAKINNMNPALIRNERLFNIFEFRSLTYEEGLIIWESEKLKKEDFQKIFFNKQNLTHSDLASAIKNKRKKMLNFLKPSSNIEILKNLNKKNNLGFK